MCLCTQEYPSIYLHFSWFAWLSSPSLVVFEYCSEVQTDLRCECLAQLVRSCNRVSLLRYWDPGFLSIFLIPYACQTSLYCWIEVSMRFCKSQGFRVVEFHTQLFLHLQSQLTSWFHHCELELSLHPFELAVMFHRMTSSAVLYHVTECTWLDLQLAYCHLSQCLVHFGHDLTDTSSFTNVARVLFLNSDCIAWSPLIEELISYWLRSFWSLVAGDYSALRQTSECSGIASFTRLVALETISVFDSLLPLMDTADCLHFDSVWRLEKVSVSAISCLWSTDRTFCIPGQYVCSSGSRLMTRQTHHLKRSSH